MDGQITWLKTEEKKEYDILEPFKKQAKKVENMVEEFKERTGKLYLYEKNGKNYHLLKQAVRKEMLAIFESIYQFSLDKKEWIQVEPKLLKFFLQFFNQLHTYTELITEEERYKIEEILFFELEYKENKPYGYSLSMHQKAKDILELGYPILKNLEEQQVIEQLTTIVSFLYHILTYSTLQLKEYKREEINVICEIGYRFLEEYVYPQHRQMETPYLCKLEEMLNCHFKNYEPKWNVHVLVKKSRNRYYKKMAQKTVNLLNQEKKSN